MMSSSSMESRDNSDAWIEELREKDTVIGLLGIYSAGVLLTLSKGLLSAGSIQVWKIFLDEMGLVAENTIWRNGLHLLAKGYHFYSSEEATAMDIREAQMLFRGPMVSVATPFTPNFELDLGALRENIAFMLARGMRAGQGVLLVAAAGGEFPMLSMEERKQVIRASVEAARGQIPVAASIQFLSTREVVELARYAHEVGAQLGQLSAPYYYPPPDEDIYQLFKTVSTETDLPLMIYNNWWNTLNMNLEMVARLSELRNVVALKWSAPSSDQFTEGLYRYANKLAIIDNEGLFVWSHMLGAVGIITHVSNFWPEYPGKIWSLLESKQYDQAIAELGGFQRRWHAWVSKVVAETEGEGPFIKAAMETVGLRAGPPRPPGRAVSPQLRAELAQLFAEMGVPRA